MFSKGLLTFLLLLFSGVCSANQEGAEEFPEIFSELDPPFMTDKRFESSCGLEGELVDNGIANMMSSNSSIGKHYFFFSIDQYIKEKDKKKEYRFYQSKDFSGTPSYVLDHDGLKNGEKTICKWRMKYDEKYLYANNLQDCFGKDSYQSTRSILSHTSDEGGKGAIFLCTIMNVESYSFDEGKFTYQIKINDQNYYLDTKDMPELQNGERFYSYEKRFDYKQSRRISEIDELIKIFSKYRTSDHYKKLVSCFFKKDKTCLKECWTNDFYEEVASAGYDHICKNNKTTSSEGPSCDDYKKFDDKISNIGFNYLKKIIEDITYLRTEDFSIIGDRIYYRIPKPHTDMNEPEIIIQLDDKLMLLSLEDGLIC